MRYCKLRIAWSVMWGTAALLLCVLWVRSYQKYENVTFRLSGYEIDFRSGRGKALYELRRPSSYYSFPGMYRTHPVIEGGLYYGKPQFEILYMHGFAPGLVDLGLTMSVIPYWLLVPVAVVIATSAWMPGRFSLRTLLIATTLVAVVLGLMVWLR